MDPVSVIALVSASMQAIEFWQNQQDRILAKQALKSATKLANDKKNIKEG